MKEKLVELGFEVNENELLSIGWSYFNGFFCLEAMEHDKGLWMIASVRSAGKECSRMNLGNFTNIPDIKLLITALKNGAKTL